MHIVIEGLCLFFGYLFLSTGLSKLFKRQEHFSSIYAYQIIPPKSVGFFGWTDMILETTIGILLVFGILIKTVLLLSIILLIVFSLAITINIMRGRTEIDCGCAGILGSHKISFWLVGRNLAMVTLIIGMEIWQIFEENEVNEIIFHTYNQQFLVLNTFIITLFLVFKMGMNVFQASKFLKEL